MAEDAAPRRSADAGAGAAAREQGAGGANCSALLRPHPFKRAFVRRRSSWEDDLGGGPEHRPEHQQGTAAAPQQHTTPLQQQQPPQQVPNPVGKGQQRQAPATGEAPWVEGLANSAAAAGRRAAAAEPSGRRGHSAAAPSPAGPFDPPQWLPRAQEQHRPWLDAHEGWRLRWQRAEAQLAAAAARAAAPAGAPGGA